MPAQLPHIPFIFIRHGETDWNRDHRTMGQKDIPLNELGIRQAHDAAQYIENSGIQRIVSSPLSRAAQTAHILNEKLNVPMIFNDLLKECGWGIQEGRLKGSMFTTESWVGGFTPENTEPYIDFRIRAVQAIITSIEDGIPTLVVAHGGIFWALMDVLGYRHRRMMNCIPVAFNPPRTDVEPWQIYSLDPGYEIEV